MLSSRSNSSGGIAVELTIGRLDDVGIVEDGSNVIEVDCRGEVGGEGVSGLRNGSLVNGTDLDDAVGGGDGGRT